MKILLCAATEMEIAPTIHYLSTHPETTIDIVITGIGLMVTSYTLTKTVIANRPDLIIQAGIAGCFTTALSLAQVVVVGNETVGDIGVKEDGRFQSIFDMKFLAPDVYPWKTGRLYNDDQLLDSLSLPIVNAVTVNEITTDKERIDYYADALGAQTESMEGAALHYIGLLEKIPFLQLRSLSNFVGERDKTKWKIKDAVQNLNTTLQHLLTKLETK